MLEQKKINKVDRKFFYKNILDLGKTDCVKYIKNSISRNISRQMPIIETEKPVLPFKVCENGENV